MVTIWFFLSRYELFARRDIIPARVGLRFVEASELLVGSNRTLLHDDR